MGHDLGVTQSYYKPSEKELAETWRKFENALRLDIEEAIPSSRMSELEAKVKTMSEQIEALQEAVTFYEGVLNRLSRQNPKLLRKLGIKD